MLYFSQFTTKSHRNLSGMDLESKYLPETFSLLFIKSRTDRGSFFVYVDPITRGSLLTSRSLNNEAQAFQRRQILLVSGSTASKLFCILSLENMCHGEEIQATCRGILGVGSLAVYCG
ncbi:hypothetical protein F511_31281 [Dorcoceras hygrometricum]|uniref:Uncharacterized protein n=1 Tax=Dorcoceras hygrometricum TaxID=472368 RepID=A0A2Z7CMX2_9LAMI|nr:hypothetical protein F511_31281 [Dorcoceras hygrometricum]